MKFKYFQIQNTKKKAKYLTDGWREVKTCVGCEASFVRSFVRSWERKEKLSRAWSQTSSIGGDRITRILCICGNNSKRQRFF